VLDGRGSPSVPDTDQVLEGQLASVGAVLEQLQSMQERLTQLQNPESILACRGSPLTPSRLHSYTDSSGGQGASVDSQCNVPVAVAPVPKAAENATCKTGEANDCSANNSRGTVAAEEQEEGRATPDAIAEARSWLLQLADTMASQQSSMDATAAITVVDNESHKAAGTPSGGSQSIDVGLAPSACSLGSESQPISATMSHRGKWVWLEDPVCSSDLKFSGGQNKHDTVGGVKAGIAGLGRERAVEHDKVVRAFSAHEPSSYCDEEKTAELQHSARLQAMCGLQEPAPPARREDLGRKQRPPQQPELEIEATPGGVLTPTEPMDADVTAEDMRDWGRAVSGILLDLASQGVSPEGISTLEDSKDDVGFLTQRVPQASDGLRVVCAGVPSDHRLSPATRLESSVGSTEEGNLSSSLASTPGFRDSGSELTSGQRSATLFQEDHIVSRRHSGDRMQPVGKHELAAASNVLSRSGSGLSTTSHRNIAEQIMATTEACRQEALQRVLANLTRPKSKSRLLLQDRRRSPDTGSVGAAERELAACAPTPSFERPCPVQRRKSAAWSEHLSDTASVSSASTRLAGRAFPSEGSLPHPPIPSHSSRDGRRSCPSHPELHLASPALRGGDDCQKVLERSATCSGWSETSCALDSTVPCGR